MFLTATLLLHIEPEFMWIMKVRPEEVHVFRAPTTRANITYSVFEYNRDVDKTEAVCRLV